MFGPPDNSWYYEIVSYIDSVILNLTGEKREGTVGLPYQPSEDTRKAVSSHFAAQFVEVTFERVPDFGYNAKVIKRIV
ncbi:MAG: hypothetical protein UW41_C0028G0003 [Candidatus Collierbacteria bacterium GW2011_GWC2_44_18]|uniref:Uncharacterized protein n=1 Tax=Candidatus Collierbacteria bacterium GW2011_GWC2_44_18 TaxID=1618392 RepID=A0A0G1HP80_9BACT|nr:MAG: hypothetical protein UW16_C0028G0032 [Microgenomates group bacterium GW2011_GWC1_44_10]KKT48463.1 MAG: hypothetical protein UW41_C0028G0003 [Candidatus Collierbacteria bacterium GW2011_GWC2_44_18]